MSFRERVYIFQTQKAAALFLRQNANLYTGDRPISDFRNVYFNTDPLPSTTFPLAWECFVSLDMARVALMSVEPELQPAFPMDGLPQDVLQAAFTGGPGRGPRCDGRFRGALLGAVGRGPLAALCAGSQSGQTADFPGRCNGLGARRGDRSSCVRKQQKWLAI